MILIPKYQDIVMELPPRSAGIAGRYKLRKGKTIGGVLDLSTGRPTPGTGVDVVTGETGWFNNIITNNGKNDFAATAYTGISAYCHCGTGSSAEAATDTALGTFVASTNTVQDSSEAIESSAPYFASLTKTFRFGEGVAEGNIAEVGISTQATTGDLFSRSLVKDGGGSPTTITVLSDEWLDVTYEFRMYPDGVTAGGAAEDNTGTVSVSGTNYDYILRSCNVNNLTFTPASLARGWYGTNGSSYGFAYGSDGALGAVTSTPSGTSQDNIGSANSSVAAATYSSDTYNRDITWTVGLNDGNVTGGIRCFYFITGMGTFQCRIGATSGDATLDKDATKVWTWVCNLAWANATIP